MAKDWRSRARDVLVVLLTVTTGAVDAAAFLHLGHVFSSVITGTLVLLGVAAGTHDAGAGGKLRGGAGQLRGRRGRAGRRCRPGGRAAGWRAGGAAARTRVIAHREIWPSWLTVALGLEFCVLAVFCVGWELSGGHPSGTWRS